MPAEPAPAPAAEGSRLLELIAVMDRLRSPGGCPWDAEQTHQSLLPYLLEEAHETVEAVESGDRAGLREELGDLLLQVVFHARVAQEDPDEPWGIEEVAGGIVDKLIRRHPHVFGGGQAATADEVEANWETLKRDEKQRESVVDGVPMGMPALSLAARLMDRAAKGGIHVEPEPLAALGEQATAEEVGQVLLAAAVAARRAGVDAEAALREAARGYAGQVRAAERAAAGRTGAEAAR
jgi:XTP/dITP diphosphohydrolase